MFETAEETASNFAVPTLLANSAGLATNLAFKIDDKNSKNFPTEKENKKHKKYYLDLSVDCQIKESKSKIYIIFEHKSYKDKLTLIQILSYCLVMWEKEINDNKKNLTPIIPFIFYHGKSKFGFYNKVLYSHLTRLLFGFIKKLYWGVFELNIFSMLSTISGFSKVEIS